jgi:hypothetical protein
MIKSLNVNKNISEPATRATQKVNQFRWPMTLALPVNRPFPPATGLSFPGQSKIDPHSEVNCWLASHTHRSASYNLNAHSNSCSVAK